MEDYFKNHTLTIIIIFIVVAGLIFFLIRRNKKDEKPFERDADESVTDQDKLV